MDEGIIITLQLFNNNLGAALKERPVILITEWQRSFTLKKF
jgi:hypothetical protein